MLGTSPQTPDYIVWIPHACCTVLQKDQNIFFIYIKRSWLAEFVWILDVKVACVCQGMGEKKFSFRHFPVFGHLDFGIPLYFKITQRRFTTRFLNQPQS